jgi:hypothetical protein
MKSVAVVVLWLWAVTGPFPARGADVTPLHFSGAIALPGVQGRFDHFACDTEGKRLFVAALGNDSLEVIDIEKLQRAGSITGLHKPTGVVLLGEPDQIGVANGDDGSFRTFDTKTLQPRVRINGLSDADNLRRDATTGFVYAGYGAGVLGVLDAAESRLLAQIKLPAHPESFQLETTGPRIFVNVPDAARVVVADREQRRVVAEWPMKKYRGNFPLALDEATHRLFVGCRHPARLVVIDTETGETVSNLEISGDIDDLFYDAKRRRLYLSGGEGFVDIVQRRSSDEYERISRQPTRAGARTCFFSAELDRLFVAVPAYQGWDAEIRVYRPE